MQAHPNHGLRRAVRAEEVFVCFFEKLSSFFVFKILKNKCELILTVIGRYPLLKYVFVGLIVLGDCLFLFKEQKAGSTASVAQFGWGEALLVSLCGAVVKAVG